MSQLLAKSMSFGYVTPIISDLSFAIESGKIVALAGSNGAGKTTVLKTLRGIIKEIGGSLSFNGKPLSQTERLSSLDFSYLASENVGAWPDLTIKENFDFLLSYRGFSQKEALKLWEEFSDSLSLQNLGDRRYSTCSTGERKALHLASQLARPQSFLILDEPLAHLDPKKSKGFFESLRKGNHTAVISLQESQWQAWQNHFDDILKLEKHS